MSFYDVYNFLLRKMCKKQLPAGLMARFSHEIRTQLTGIVGYAEFLEGKTHEPMLNFTAKIIRESGLNLSRITGSYFELNNLFQGRVKLSYSSFVFSELVRDVVRQRQGAALEKGVSLSYSCAQEITEDTVNSDMHRLQQVLEALVVGTVELLDKWSILHVVLCQDDAHGGGWLLNLEFSDLATKSSCMHLYESFWNDDFYEFKLQEGPGVLLSMVKQTLLVMGCDVQFEFDTKTGGSRLIIALPFSS